MEISVPQPGKGGRSPVAGDSTVSSIVDGLWAWWLLLKAHEGVFIVVTSRANRGWTRGIMCTVPYLGKRLEGWKGGCQRPTL